MNHSSVTHLTDSTPEEAWSGIKPDVTALCPFSCPTYVHIPKVKCTKLSFKTKKCVMIGYKPGTKAYQLWDPQACKVIVSCDVIFDEHPKPLALPAPPANLSQIFYNGELPGDDTPGITQVGDAWNKQTWNLYPLPPSLPSPILSSNWMKIPLTTYLSQLNNHMIILMIPLLLLVTNVELNLNF